MSVLQWDLTGQRTFETGVDRGVLYLQDGTAYPWNGLTSLEEQFNAGAATPLYFDGIKYNEIVLISDFTAIMKAYTYPEEFNEVEGIYDIGEPGVYATAQQPKSFGLSYRTKIGSDVTQDEGYKIHVLRNLNAVPANVNYKTIGNSPEAIEFSWNLTAIPEQLPGFRPTAHLIFDSTKMDIDLLNTIEDVLYGTDVTEATLPSFAELIVLVNA